MHRVVAPLVLASVVAASAPGQVSPTAPTRAADAADAQPAPRTTPSGIAARAVARIAMADLKLMKPATDRDYRITAEMIEHAHVLDPNDQDILRLLIQAWTAAGDSDRVDELNRELLRLDPRDTVTQLAIISARINRLQNTDERLAAFEKFLGSEGASLDPAIRSRLAMDAALLKRERGDDDGFAKTLATACQLDPTNKDAATLALAYFADRVPDAVGRFELLTNVLKADPFDPDVHASMAQDLSAAGAYRAAGRIYDTLRRLRKARAEQLLPQETAEILVSDWNIDGAEVLIRRLTEQIESSRADLRSRRERITAAGQVLTQVADPAEVRLSIPFERTRVVAAAAVGDPELIGYALSEAEESIRRTIEMLASTDRRPEGMSEEEAARTMMSLRVERVWLRLWSGRMTDEAAAEFEDLRGDPDIDAPVLARMEACIKMRQGMFDEAEQALTGLARDDILSALALGILAEVRGQKEPAVRLYTELSNRLAGSIAGAFCRTRVIQMTGRPPAPTELARKLQALADAVPNSLEAMIADPRRFVDLRVEPVNREVGMLDKIQVRLTIENTSRFALAVGPNHPINSRFLFAPIVDIGVRRLSIPGLQDIAWLNRRLRLQPGERLDATVWADPGILGGLLQRLGGSSARIRWRVVQGFKLNRDGYYDPGPLCLSTETATISRSPSMRSVAELSSLYGWIEKGTSIEMAESILAFIERILTRAPGQPEVTQADIDAFVAAMLKRFARADIPEKSIILVLCPSAVQSPAFAALDAEMAKEEDEGLLKCFLALRAPSETSPLLAPDAWSARPRVQAFADLLRARLADGVRTIAAIGARAAMESTDQAPPGDAPPEPAPAQGR